jgi:hypothetical protein
MSDLEKLAAQLWDALRIDCCSTGLKAKRIVMLHEGDVLRALKRIQNSDLQKQPDKI